MNLFKQLFVNQEVSAPPKDETFIPTKICESINQIAIDVFKQYYSQLIDKSATYIVQAVWGLEVNGFQPTPLQIEIHKIIEPMFHHINSKIERTTTEQSLISTFLIQELISAKLNFMISESNRVLIEKRSISMLKIETIGCA